VEGGEASLVAGVQITAKVDQRLEFPEPFILGLFG
jgi:hypothetical protein